MESKDLAELPEVERVWLERVVYKYLIALKNRDCIRVEKLATNNQLEVVAEEDAVSDGQLEKQKKEEATRASHLYVLPYSFQPKDWDDPDSMKNNEVKKEIGFSLLELNQHFVLAQKDSQY